MLVIIWTPTSRESYSQLLQYLEENYGLESALSLLDKTDETIERISKFPSLFPSSTKFPSIRIATISKQTSILYKASSTKIKILEFIDNRMNIDIR